MHQMLGFKELREQFPEFAKELEELLVWDTGTNAIDEGDMAFIGKPCTCHPRLKTPASAEWLDIERELGELKAKEPGWAYGPGVTFIHRDSKSCPRHGPTGGNTYYSSYAQEGDPPDAYHYDWPKPPPTVWPKVTDPTDPISVMDGYVRAIHGVAGIEEWLKGNLQWRRLDTPMGGVEAVIEWNEPGEPGGCNPGGSYWFFVDGKWVSETDSWPREGETYSYMDFIEAFYSDEESEG